MSIERHGGGTGSVPEPVRPKPVDNGAVTRSTMMSAGDPVVPRTAGGRLEEGPLHRILGYQLAQAAVVTRAVFEAQVAQAFGLRPVEYTVLALVHQNPGLTGGKLAAALAVTPSNITMWIDRLDQRGLVTRGANSADRRSLHIHATPAGAELVRQATERLFEGEHQRLSALTPGERMLLVELLHKVAHSR